MKILLTILIISLFTINSLIGEELGDSTSKEIKIYPHKEIDFDIPKEEIQFLEFSPKVIVISHVIFRTFLQLNFPDLEKKIFDVPQDSLLNKSTILPLKD